MNLFTARERAFRRFVRADIDDIESTAAPGLVFFRTSRGAAPALKRLRGHRETSRHDVGQRSAARGPALAAFHPPSTVGGHNLHRDMPCSPVTR